MTNITIFHNGADPDDFTVFEQVEDTCAVLVREFGSKFPDTARIYHDVVAQDHDVTPGNNNEAMIERLQSLEGNLFIVVWPEGVELIMVIVAIAIAAVSIGLTFLFRPKTQGQNEGSPNNELGSRENKARPNERIPEILGTVRATPDLLALPYKFFVDNQEFECTYMGVSKGSVTVLDCKDDTTPIDQINGEYVAVYPPFNSPNSLVPAPQATFGIPPTTIPRVVAVQQSSSVNGQVLRAPNSGNLETNNNVAFQYGGIMLTNDSNVDFTQYFVASTPGNDQFLNIATNDDGVNASDSSGIKPSVGLAGTYRILSVAAGQVVFDNPATINANWNALANYGGQTSSYYHTFAITSTGNKWVGPYILSADNLSEVWCNFVAQNGLYYVDNKGRQGALTATVMLGVQAVDENYLPVGDEITATANMTGSALVRNIVGATLKCKLPSEGNVQVRALLITNMGTDSRNNYSQQIQWRDLYAVSNPSFDAGEVTQSPLGLGALVGAFTDATGTVILPLGIGNSATFTVPAGATQLQLGINDDNYADNSGSYNVTATSGTNTWTGTLDSKVMPWSSSYNPSYAYGKNNGSAPLVALTGLNTGDSVIITYNSGTILLGGYTSVNGNGSPSDITGSTGGSTGTGFVTKYMTVGGSLWYGDFGNITTALAITAQTPDALAIKDRKINMLVTRNLPTWINRSVPGTPQISTELYPTNNAADIILALALDPQNGRRTIAELDVAELYSVADCSHLGGEHVDGEIVSYFGSSLMTEFCYTLDDSKISFEEIMADIGQAINCTPYRQGSTIGIAFEKQTSDSAILFNHRNKLPGSEQRTVTFGPLNDNDGITYDYIDPNAPNYPQTDTTITLYYPADQSAINPKKITSIGVRNPIQAQINAWRMYLKLLNANQQTIFTATSEAAQVLANQRVLVADDTRSDTQAGEIVGMSGLTATTSQKLTFETGHTYTAFFQLYDCTVQAIAVTPGASANQMVLSSAPTLSLVTDAANYAKTTYLLVDNGAASTTSRAIAFLINDKQVENDGTFKLTAINYTDAYYPHDQDVINGVLVPPSAGYGTQGYIGIGLVTPTGGTYTPAARGSFNLSSYTGSSLNTTNNVPAGQQVTEPPTSNAQVNGTEINGTSTGAPTVNFGTLPAAVGTGRNVVFQTGGNSDLQTASAYMPVMTGDTGSGGVAGLVPAPAAGDAAAGKVLKADGTWHVPMQNPMTTAGDIIIAGAAGLPTRLGAGSAAQVLTANGAGLAPSWQAATGGGGGTGWGGGEAAFTAPVLASFTQDNFGTTGTSTVAENITNGIRLRERGAGGNINHLRSLLVAIPTATSKWTVTARLRRQTPISVWHDLGLVLNDSVSGKYVQYGWGADSGTPFVYVTWATNSAVPASAPAYNFSVNQPHIYADMWLRVYFDGTNLNFQYSGDGQYYIPVRTTTPTAYLTNPANRCGIGINPNNIQSNIETVLDCFSFSVVNN